MNKSVVYKTTNLKNHKTYIGVDTKNDPNYLGSGKILRKAIEKYGRDSFVKEIIREFQTPEEAFEYEKILIEKMDAVNSQMYYNVKPGGKGGHNGYDYSGENNPMHGRSMKEIFINKYGENGEFMLKEIRRKAAESTRGQTRDFTSQHKENLSKSIKEYYSNLTEEEHRIFCESIKNSVNVYERSEKHRKEMSDKIKSVSSKIHRIETCIHCGVSCNVANISRWHNDNCKNKK